jgi:Flp pilus assembly protein TadD
MNPNHGASYNGMGLVYDQYKKSDKALGYFKKASELNPENPVYLQNRGCCLRSLEK